MRVTLLVRRQTESFVGRTLCWFLISLKAHVRYIKICNITAMLSGHFSIFGLVFFLLNSLLGIARQWSRENFANFDPQNIRVMLDF